MPFLYVSLAQHSPLERETVVIRASGTLAAIGGAVQSTIRTLDPALPVFDVHPFESILRERADRQRGISTLLAAFGVLALLLAAVGLYGVMAYAVTSRTREMGVRLALGASPDQLAMLVTRDGVTLALRGLVIGTLLALPMASALGALVFGVQIGDVGAYIAACALLLVVSIGAAFLPARRVAAMDPMVALRAE